MATGWTRIFTGDRGPGVAALMVDRLRSPLRSMARGMVQSLAVGREFVVSRWLAIGVAWRGAPVSALRSAVGMSHTGGSALPAAPRGGAPAAGSIGGAISGMGSTAGLSDRVVAIGRRREAAAVVSGEFQVEESDVLGSTSREMMIGSGSVPRPNPADFEAVPLAPPVDDDTTMDARDGDADPTAEDEGDSIDADDLPALAADAESEGAGDEQVGGVERLDAVVESLLLAAGAPLPVRRMVDVLGGPKSAELRAAVARLMEHYSGAGRGIHLVEVASGFQFRTAPANAKFVRTLLREKPSRLGRAALETLSIVAYKQPVTRGEIEAIRGVDADSAINTLLARKLIKIDGRKETVGRPLLYSTTPEFLEVFGLKDLRELPTLKEIGPVPEPDYETDIEEEDSDTAGVEEAIVEAATASPGRPLAAAAEGTDGVEAVCAEGAGGAADVDGGAGEIAAATVNGCGEIEAAPGGGDDEDEDEDPFDDDADDEDDEDDDDEEGDDDAFADFEDEDDVEGDDAFDDDDEDDDEDEEDEDEEDDDR